MRNKIQYHEMIFKIENWDVCCDYIKSLGKGRSSETLNLQCNLINSSYKNKRLNIGCLYNINLFVGNSVNGNDINSLGGFCVTQRIVDCMVSISKEFLENLLLLLSSEKKPYLVFHCISESNKFPTIREVYYRLKLN